MYQKIYVTEIKNATFKTIGKHQHDAATSMLQPLHDDNDGDENHHPFPSLVIMARSSFPESFKQSLCCTFTIKQIGFPK